MSLQDKQIFTFDIPEELQGLVRKHYDDFVIDETLTNLGVLLVCMHILEHEKNKSGSDYDECKRMFVQFGKKEDSFRKVLSKAKEQKLLTATDKTIKFLNKGLKKINEIASLKGKTPVYIIKAGENFSSIKLFEEFLVDQVDNDEILLCDSHISYETLLPFIPIKESIKSIRILTANIYDKTKFNAYLEKMKKEFKINIEVKENKRIHDRYIIFKNSCWSIGTSIKDLGNKDSIIQEVLGVINTLKDLFNERWNESS
ncbi:hypothetical protein ES708_18547 [subsurface metagenome]